ncbi:hypothetical protein KHA80_22305 [Anaerobacillus sp. HL2]|nr:hypothetical protein KHA80_22305 [Anaerobacillus sp. HL2]
MWNGEINGCICSKATNFLILSKYLRLITVSRGNENYFIDGDQATNQLILIVFNIGVQKVTNGVKKVFY